MKKGIVAAATAALMVIPLRGQVMSFEEMSPELSAPVFDARLSIGFNYDLLRPPTEVSFDYPKGYFGLNIPIQGTVNPLDVANMYGRPVDRIFGDSTLFQEGNEFKPRASAAQSPNTTFRVDVPMLGGVGSFSNIQNVAVSYANTLGFPSAKFGMAMKNVGVNMLMRAAINAPMEIGAKWETMTFGYAYKPTKNLALAFNLHRHIFVFDMHAKITGDVLGYLTIDQNPISDSIPIEYSITGDAYAHYDAEAWSPTLGVKFWRLGATARFGVNTRAKGRLKASYSLPFFVNGETFRVSLKPEQLTDLAYINRLKEGKMDTINNSTSEDMVWKLPNGFTFSFDLIRDKLNVSYTKTSGDVELGLSNIWRLRANVGDLQEAAYDTVNLDLGFTVDHAIMLSGIFRNVFFNMGVFTLDFYANGQRKILSRALEELGYPMLGNAPIMPVLNAGSAIGARMQLLLEMDILPLLALKTGIIYYF